MAATVRFTNEQGVSLAARLELPADEVPIGFALLAHCFTCSKDLTSLRRCPVHQTLTTTTVVETRLA